MIRRMTSLIKSTLGRRRFESEMDGELRDHMEKYADDLVSQGIPRHEAELRSRREFGAVEAIKEECRESKGLALTDALVRNFRYAFRVLRKSPAFTVTAVLTLALCIGANTAIFSVVDAVLFRPLQYPEPGRLGRITTFVHTSQGSNEDTSITGRRWEYLRDHVRSLDLALHATTQGANLAATEGAEFIQQLRVSSGFFRVLGVLPFLGREIDSEEDRPGGPAVTVLSHVFWKRVMKSDPQTLGKTIVLRGEPYTVIGVMPEGFNTTPPVDLWTPLRPSTKGEGSGSNYALIGRIRSGYDRRQVEAELSKMGPSFISDNHIKMSAGGFMQFHLDSMQRVMADDFRVPLSRPLLLLWAAVGLILLIGCINVAALMLARGSARRHEIATRLALGSGRRGILGQLLAESFLLAAAGGAGGLMLGYGSLAGLRWMAAQSLDLTQPMTIDFRVLAMTGVAAFLASLLFGFYPAWEAARVDIRSGLLSSGRNLAGSRRAWPRRGLVVCEVALGTILLIGAGLMIRTVGYLAGLNAGFDGRSVFTGKVSLQDARYATSSNVNRLLDEALAKIRRYPGVQSAGAGLTLPYERALNDGTRVLDGPHAATENRESNVTYVTPGYFETLKMNLLRGRLFEASDQINSQHVAIVNEAFVKEFFRGDSPLGLHLATNRNSEIVGVVGDVPMAGFSDPLGPIPNIYVPASQQPDAFFQLVHTWFMPTLLVRSSGSQAEIASAMSAAVASADSQLPFAGFRTMDEVRFRSFAMQRLESMLLGSLAGLALLLAAVGIYGLIAHSVAERTREFGIRMALGSSVGRVIGAAVRPGIILATAGVAIGYVLARWSSTLLRSIVYGVQLTDPATCVTVISVLLAVAVLASVVPSFRIARIDPARTLREE